MLKTAFILVSALAVFCLMSSMAAASSACTAAQEIAYQEGGASYYADALAGRKTASGEPFDPRALTAAHRSLKFGTLVEVKNVLTGRRVIVRINDRGPFVDGRVIDVSSSAAQALGSVRQGVVPVTLNLCH